MTPTAKTSKNKYFPFEVVDIDMLDEVIIEINT